jgi:hypothetical protein
MHFEVDPASIRSASSAVSLFGGGSVLVAVRTSVCVYFSATFLSLLVTKMEYRIVNCVRTVR